MREAISCLESYSSCIKQETSNELSFTEKFIHIMEKVQSENMITKDLILQLMQLFFQNNSLFIQLFETSFLLIFKTYANEGARFNKYESQQVIEKYSQFLKLFLTQMINMELEVKKTTQEEQYFENFIDFYISFFAEAIASSKSFIKEFSYNILVTSIKIIDEVLDMELLALTQNQLIQSCLYLLGSNFEEFKKMGVQLYAVLKKIKITSVEIEQLLFEIIQSQSNFQLRKLVILQGISLKEQEKIDRLLNRLKDKNPQIIQIVLQKLIHERIKFQNLNYDQRIKILIDGAGSHHVNVKQKSCQFLSMSLLRFMNFNKLKKLEQKDNEEQEQSGLQRFLNLFNSDDFSTKTKSYWRDNLLVKSMSLEYVSLLFLRLSPQILKIEIKRLFNSTEDLKMTMNQSAFLFNLLRRIGTEQQTQQMNSFRENIIDIKRFIDSADFIHSLNGIIKNIRKKINYNTQSQQIQKFGILLKTIHLLIKKFDVTDLAGKQNIYSQLKKFILEFDYINRNTQGNNNQKERLNYNYYKQKLLEQQLRKLNNLLSRNEQQKNSLILPVINHPLDLLSLSVQIMLSCLSQKQINNALIQLKIHINELHDNKQLALQREINTKILLNTCAQISKAQKGSQQTKPIENLRVIKTQLEKRLTQNKYKVKNNIIKAFTILARVVYFEQKNCSIKNGSSNKNSVTIKASQYIQQIKSYLYNNDNDDDILQSQTQQQILTLYQIYSYNYLPYVLIYYYCKQSEQNYKLFRKLFYYYGLQQDQTVLVNNTKNRLTKLTNLRLLTQLQLQYQMIEQNNGLDQSQLNNNNRSSISQFVQTLISRALNNKHKDKIDKQHCNNNQLQATLYQQILIKILSQSKYYANNTKYLTTLIVIAFKQIIFQKQSQANHYHYHYRHHHIFTRQLLLTFQQQSKQQQHDVELFQAILCVYQSVITYLCQNQLHQQQKPYCNSLLNRINKLFLTFLKITNYFSNSNTNQSKQCLHKYFTRFIKIIHLFNKVFQNAQLINIIKVLRLKNIFTHLYQNKTLEQQKNSQSILHSLHVNTQLLVFTKRKVQQSFQLLKNNSTLKNHDSKKQYLIFLSDLQLIDQKLQQEIFKRLQEKDDQYDQQSTDHSPNQHIQNCSERTKKVNISLIELYEETLYKELKFKDQQLRKIAKYIQKHKIFQQLIRISKQKNQQIQNNQTNQPNIEGRISENQQIIQNQQQVIIQDPKSDLSLIFDRRGRRKDKLSGKYMKFECYQVKASIKKNRYLIIPFQIVQKAQWSSKKLKNQQKRLKEKKFTSQKSQNSIIYPKIQNFIM